MPTYFSRHKIRWLTLFSVGLLLGLAFLARTAQAGQLPGWLRTFRSTASIGVDAPDVPQASDAATIAVEIWVSNAAALGAWEFDLDYDPALIRIDGMNLNPAFAIDPACDPASQRCLVQLGPLDVDGDTTAVGAFSYGTGPGLNGNALLATLHLTPLGCPGTTPLTITGLLATDVDANPASVTAVADNLTLQSPPLVAAISLNNDDVDFAWTSPQCSYALYRDAVPYTGGTNLLQSLPGSARSAADPNAAAALTNYYYTLIGLDSSGAAPVDATAVGLFHFAITPGS